MVMWRLIRRRMELRRHRVLFCWKHRRTFKIPGTPETIASWVSPCKTMRIQSSSNSSITSTSSSFRSIISRSISFRSRTINSIRNITIRNITISSSSSRGIKCLPCIWAVEEGHRHRRDHPLDHPSRRSSVFRDHQ